MTRPDTCNDRASDLWRAASGLVKHVLKPYTGLNIRQNDGPTRSAKKSQKEGRPGVPGKYKNKARGHHP